MLDLAQNSSARVKILTPTIIVEKKKKKYIYIVGPLKLRKSHPHRILQVPTTQLAKMSFDPEFVELTADVLEICL